MKTYEVLHSTPEEAWFHALALKYSSLLRSEITYPFDGVNVTM